MYLRSMLPDVIDEFMIKTGERKEPIFYSFFEFFIKVISGFAIAIASFILEYHLTKKSIFLNLF